MTKPQGPRPCAECGTIFNKKNARAFKYCSDNCYRVVKNRKTKESRDRNPGYHRQHRYGLSPSDVAALEQSQDGACAICKRPERKLVVDHCHTTGKVRGLLCYGCNVALGLVAECPDLLDKMKAYLGN